ncbi:MAG: hypothetical protein U1D06_03705 [Paracoccaceae bacterium]|nr:hypothetical protein [Paracoccaceae bacterium]
MDFGRIITMIVNRLLRRAVNTGVNKGINRMAGKGKPDSQMTPAERSQASKGREMAKRARQAARITRRLGR